MDGLTRLKHNVCGPGLCETRMHAYGRSLRALTEREATTHDHEREPVWSRWSLQPGRRDQPPRNAAHASSQSRSSFHNNKRYCTVLLLGLLAWMVLLRLLPGKSTVPVPVNNVPDGKLPVCPMPLSHQDLEAIQGDVIPHPLFRPMRLTIT